MCPNLVEIKSFLPSCHFQNQEAPSPKPSQNCKESQRNQVSSCNCGRMNYFNLKSSEGVTTKTPAPPKSKGEISCTHIPHNSQSLFTCIFIAMRFLISFSSNYMKSGAAVHTPLAPPQSKGNTSGYYIHHHVVDIHVQVMPS
jgi:hypothetical protein